MYVLELFAGHRSIGRAFEAKGHTVFSVDWGEFDEIDLRADMEFVEAEQLRALMGRTPDVIWASPDCTTHSIAGISHHRRQELIQTQAGAVPTGYLLPVSDYARKSDRVLAQTLQIIAELNPLFYFIENPRGGMRKSKMLADYPRHTVTYCQYGDTRMKPTDIWTNHGNPRFRPMCKNGDTCHTRAPRGSATPGSTQGHKDAATRSLIPAELCSHIVTICEG